MNTRSQKLLLLAAFCFFVALLFVGFIARAASGAVYAPVPRDAVTDALDIIHPEPPISDLWIYRSGNIGLKPRVLDVFLTGKKWASLRGDEPAYTHGSNDDIRWRECRKMAETEVAGLWIVCLDTDRLDREVTGVAPP